MIMNRTDAIDFLTEDDLTRLSKIFEANKLIGTIMVDDATQTPVIIVRNKAIPYLVVIETLGDLYACNN